MQFRRDDLQFCDTKKAILYARGCIKFGTYWHTTDCKNPSCVFNDPAVKKLARYGSDFETYVLRMSIEVSSPLSKIVDVMGDQDYHFIRSTCTQNGGPGDFGQFCSDLTCAARTLKAEMGTVE